jgi:serine/threonine-protein kinase
LPASLVVLDGKAIGSTPKVQVRVKAGTHTVVFTNSELGVMKEVSVTVGSGETKLAVARLRE